MTPSLVTVFGGSGFLGRHLVQRLAAGRARVTVAVRNPESALFLKPMGDVGQITPVGADVRDGPAVAAAVQGADWVVNLVGVLYETKRQSFGATLAEHEGVRWLLGDAAMQIEIGRLLTMRAAAKLDSGDFARKEVSMAKIAVAEVLHQAVDTAIQLIGARGYSKDTPLEWMYRYARQARLVDGASEIHKMVLSRALLNDGIDFWGWD